MSTDTQIDEDDVELYEDEGDSYQPYRALSKAAVFSFFLCLLSLAAFVFPALLVLAFIGLILGLLARRNLRRYPEELTGRIPAFVGTFGCGLVLVCGSAMHTYIYATEVPEGFQRITFDDLQFSVARAQGKQPTLPVQLDGKRVFVKGYVHPSVSGMAHIKKFVLVPDMKTCCFGGQPKLTDMIEVTLVKSKGIRYTQRKRKLAGVFHVHNRIKKVAGNLDGGYYELRAEYVK